MDIIYTEIKLFSDVEDQHEQLWSITKNVAWVINDKWMTPDKGIWEFRGEDQHFTFSKVLCWVAIDRAIKVAELFKNDINVQELIVKKGYGKIYERYADQCNWNN